MTPNKSLPARLPGCGFFERWEPRVFVAVRLDPGLTAVIPPGCGVAGVSNRQSLFDNGTQRMTGIQHVLVS